MFPLLLFLFIFIPLMELALLIQVGQWIGIWRTITLVVLTGVLGAYLARYQGLNIITRINRSLATGEMPSDAVFDGVMIFCGGVLLLTPGIITDAFLKKETLWFKNHFSF